MLSSSRRTFSILAAATLARAVTMRASSSVNGRFMARESR
jgi:hypothetical protein